MFRNFFSALTSLLVLFESARAQTFTTVTQAEFDAYEELGAVGWLYAQENCTAPFVDTRGHRWNYVGSAATGTSNRFATPLLRRDDLKEYYLFFPGSSTPEDLRDNLMIKLVPYPFCSGCTVHQGFLGLWTSIRQAHVDLLREKALNDLVNNGYTLFVGGGSLGGALGALAFADLKSTRPNGINPSRGGSLGQPRTGNFVFAKWFNGLTGATNSRVGSWIRLTHGYDLIVKLPPVPRPGIVPPFDVTSPDLYQHHGTEIWFQDSGFANRPQRSSTYVCLNNFENAESQLCANGPPPPLPQFPGNPGDHTNYPGYDTLTCPQA